MTKPAATRCCGRSGPGAVPAREGVGSVARRRVEQLAARPGDGVEDAFEVRALRVVVRAGGLLGVVAPVGLLIARSRSVRAGPGGR